MRVCVCSQQAQGSENAYYNKYLTQFKQRPFSTTVQLLVSIMVIPNNSLLTTI